MTTVRFSRFTCEQAQDSFGRDQAFLAFFVDGSYAGNIYRGLATGDAVDFGFTLDYENQVRVQLWEVDDPAAGNPHDFLGEITIESRDARTEGTFELAGGRYRLGFEVQSAEAPAATQVLRKNEANMSDAERERFLETLQVLIDNETFGRYVEDHAGPNGDFVYRNHNFASPFGEARFLSWHRAYLINLERDLREVDSRVFIPYWRWTTNRGIPQWLTDFTPPVPMPIGPNRQVTRTPATWPLPTASDVNGELSHSTFDTFSPAIESGTHGRVHTWIGGTMSNARIASSDVLFWLHHCEIDRLWDVWQRRHSDGPTLPASERVMDPYNETADQVHNVEDLGYAYA